MTAIPITGAELYGTWKRESLTNGTRTRRYDVRVAYGRLSMQISAAAVAANSRRKSHIFALDLDNATTVMRTDTQPFRRIIYRLDEVSRW